METKCGVASCNRKASAYRVIVDGEAVRICSRHAAIEKHYEAERYTARVMSPDWMKKR